MIRVRSIILEVEALKAKKNKTNKEISSKKNIKDNIESMKKLSIKIKELDSKLNAVKKDINNSLLYIPNIIHSSVPIGKDETYNKVVREWGTKPKFDFDIKGHIELCELNYLIDFKRAT